MPIKVLMPALSPTMTEGTIATWKKKEGDKVKPGDVIAEIETDKATMEVEAVDEGTIGKILIAAGTENVAVNTMIAVLLEDGEKSDTITAFVNDNSQAKDTQISCSLKAPEAPASAPVITRPASDEKNSIFLHFM